MLSKQQFFEKNKVRFDNKNLSQAERTKRYRDYQMSRAFKTGNTTSVKKQGTYRPGGVMPKSYSTMSECSKHYALALTNPWAMPEAPCVPDVITIPSYKFGARIRGSFFVGTLGTGFIAINCYTPWSDGTGVTTTAAYASASFSGGLPGTSSIHNDSPFLLNQFTPTNGTGKRFRLVGCGVAVRYTGNEMQRGGSMLEFRHPDNLRVPDPATFDALLATRETTTVPVDREWHYAVWRPARIEDLAYSDGNITANINMLVMVSGATVNMSFEYDVIQWFEIIGSAMPQVTPSHSDPIGMSVIQTAISNVQPAKNPSTTFVEFVREIGKVASETLSFLGPVGDIVREVAPLVLNPLM